MGPGLNRPDNVRGLLFLTDDQLRKGIEAMFFAIEDLQLTQIGSWLKNLMGGRIIARCILFNEVLAQR